MPTLAFAQGPVAYIDSTTGKVTYVTQALPLPVTGAGGGGSVTVAATASAAAPTYSAGAQPLSQDLNGNLRTVTGPSSASSAGITPVVSTAVESNHILKGSAGNLYGVYITTGATPGFMMVFNATTAPADGAVTPNQCIVAPANSTTGLTFNSGPPSVFSTGITAVFSSTGCFTKTASATAFFNGRVQ